jgi:hypothetical protein
VLTVTRVPLFGVQLFVLDQLKSMGLMAVLGLPLLLGILQVITWGGPHFYFCTPTTHTHLPPPSGRASQMRLPTDVWLFVSVISFFLMAIYPHVIGTLVVVLFTIFLEGRGEC